MLMVMMLIIIRLMLMMIMLMTQLLHWILMLMMMILMTMLPTFRQTNTSNMSSFMSLLLLLMDWDDRSRTCCYIIHIHIHKVSDWSVGNFHNLVFCIFLINQVGFSMFDTTIMYSQLSRMYRTLKFWLRLMFRVKKCWNSLARMSCISSYVSRVYICEVWHRSEW